MSKVMSAQDGFARHGLFLAVINLQSFPMVGAMGPLKKPGFVGPSFQGCRDAA